MDENCRLRQGEGYGVCCDAGIDPYGCGGDLEKLSRAAAVAAMTEGETRIQWNAAGAVVICGFCAAVLRAGKA